MSSTKETGAIILAGGSSSRLGKPKQLLEFDGKSLLQKSMNAVGAFDNPKDITRNS